MPTIRTPVLQVEYLEAGPPDGPVAILLHGWPSDVHDYDGVIPPLAEAGYRVLVPWLRGFGPTRFLDRATPRSGQQAALGADVRDFMDALSIPRATLVGYDWGGRAACVVAALWPARVAALVAITGYGIQDIAGAVTARRGGAGVPSLVPMVFPHRPGPRRPDRQSRRHRPPALAAVVAELGVR